MIVVVVVVVVGGGGGGGVIVVKLVDIARSFLFFSLTLFLSFFHSFFLQTNRPGIRDYVKRYMVYEDPEWVKPDYCEVFIFLCLYNMINKISIFLV